MGEILITFISPRKMTNKHNKNAQYPENLSDTNIYIYIKYHIYLDCCI